MWTSTLLVFLVAVFPCDAMLVKVEEKETIVETANSSGDPTHSHKHVIAFPPVSIISTTTKVANTAFSTPGERTTDVIDSQTENDTISRIGIPAFQDPVEPPLEGRLCGYPIYNNRNLCLTSDPHFDLLSSCEVDGGAIAFACVMGLLGALMIFGNSLLPIVVWKNPDMRTQYDVIKVSLAFADMITGFLILCAVLPNVFWLRNMTEGELIAYIISDVDSVRAVVVGSLITISSQASLLHLMFLSIERFTAIKWSFWHIRRKTSTIAITLFIIWIVSVLCSFLPSAFPDHFEYAFQPTLLIHTMTLKRTQHGRLGLDGPLYASLTLLLPYSITLLFCVMTGIVSYRKLTSGVRKLNKEAGEGSGTPTHSHSPTHQKGNHDHHHLKPEVSVFVTIVIMVVAFSVTLLPFTIVLFLFVGGILDCSNFTIYYGISFYVGMLNSLANAHIYTIRNKRFREAVYEVFCLNKKSQQRKAQALPNLCDQHSSSNV